MTSNFKYRLENNRLPKRKKIKILKQRRAYHVMDDLQTGQDVFLLSHGSMHCQIPKQDKLDIINYSLRPISIIYLLNIHEV